MNGQTNVNSFEYEIDALAAIQLGWLVVETFGRLRRYQRAIRKPESRQGDQARPFAFSVNESLSLDALVWRVNQLHYRVEKANLPPPPCPKGDELEKQLDEGFDLDALHADLDNWSRQVWSLLNVEMGVLGQAFFLAALSSFVVVISGLVTRFFSWINLSGDFVEERLKHQLILMKTYRSWKSSREPDNNDAVLAPGEALGEGQ